MLEARGRVGGRLHTVDLAGLAGRPRRLLAAPSLGQPAAALRRRGGHRVPARRSAADIPGFDLATGTWLTPTEMDESAAADLGAFVAALGGLREQLGPDASAADGIEAFVAATGLAGDVAAAGAAGTSGERRGGRGRCRGAAVAAVAVDPGRVRRRLLRRPAPARVRRGRGRHGVRARRPPRLAGGAGRADGRRRPRLLGLRADRDRARTSSSRCRSESSRAPCSTFAPPLPSGTGPGDLPAGLRALREGRAEVRRGPSGARPGGRTSCSSRPTRPNRRRGSSTSMRSASGPILACHVFHSATGDRVGGLAGRGGPLGDGPARGCPGRTVPRAAGGRGDRLGGRPVHRGLLHPRDSGFVQRRPGPPGHAGRRSDPLRGRAHPERAASATPTVP